MEGPGHQDVEGSPRHDYFSVKSIFNPPPEAMITTYHLNARLPALQWRSSRHPKLERLTRPSPRYTCTAWEVSYVSKRGTGGCGNDIREVGRAGRFCRLPFQSRLQCDG